MNINNIQKAIAIMERAKARDSVDMRNWQSNGDGKYVGIKRCDTEVILAACGNKASFGGHIAISPEWKADGGSMCFGGTPITSDKYQEGAIADWLGVSTETACCLLYGEGDVGESSIYPVPKTEAKAEHIIHALNQLLELGEEKCLELWVIKA